jgi:hypothetical protein
VARILPPSHSLTHSPTRIPPPSLPPLPSETWALVLSFLHAYEEFPAALVCKDWYESLVHKRMLRGEDKWRTWIGAAVVSVPMLQWARGEGLEWGAMTVSTAAEGGHGEVVRWAVENGCPWEPLQISLHWMSPSTAASIEAWLSGHPDLRAAVLASFDEHIHIPNELCDVVAPIILSETSVMEHWRIEKAPAWIHHLAWIAVNARSSEYRAGGLEAIVSGLARPCNWVVSTCCKMLGQNDLCRASILRAGGVEAIVGAMQAHSDGSHVQYFACEALQYLSESVVAQPKICEAGGLEAIVAAMQGHPNDDELQAIGCGVFSILALGKERDYILEVGGIVEAIVAAMKAHHNVQNIACSALVNLADMRIGTIHRAGGLEAIVAAMQGHPNDDELQACGCDVLSNLAICFGSNTRIQQAGGVEAIVEAMQAHSRSERVQEAGVEALRNVAGIPMDHYIQQAGGIEVIVAAMQAYPCSECVQEAGVGALCTLAEIGMDDYIQQAGGIAVIVSAMQTYPCVQEAGVEALRYLSLADELVGVLGDPERKVLADQLQEKMDQLADHNLRRRGLFARVIASLRE